jgi:hypothetical protein
VDVHERRAHEEQVELFQRMTRRMSRWHIAKRDEPLVVVDDQDAAVFQIKGQWTPYLVEFFTSVRVDSLLKMSPFRSRDQHDLRDTRPMGHATCVGRALAARR